ncbi:hypothetical protein M431DRAFT_512343 [Trichoderma harzianum CBS 226.95]|uniref:Uncharacterized protein n=1 Tax=Trichoderma harzianum CBS 226.95 TaxID=983964 RepID=A0A2T3ZZ85_TRIHA|nr:hypothetical protein M431DRAFT_512343 [Trichoderma harzianum CBS 226.95]PTB50127.1 hypothetical protein M431DRAFT_512343 [Trichoderma harzianum CBS 226.95]
MQFGLPRFVRCLSVTRWLCWVGGSATQAGSGYGKSVKLCNVPGLGSEETSKASKADAVSSEKARQSETKKKQNDG